VQKNWPDAHGDLLFVDQGNKVVEEVTPPAGSLWSPRTMIKGRGRQALPPSQSSTGRARPYRTPPVSPIIADTGHQRRRESDVLTHQPIRTWTPRRGG
jgi:hypothetical protein